MRRFESAQPHIVWLSTFETSGRRANEGDRGQYHPFSMDNTVASGRRNASADLPSVECGPRRPGKSEAQRCISAPSSNGSTVGWTHFAQLGTPMDWCARSCRGRRDCRDKCFPRWMRWTCRRRDGANFDCARCDHVCHFDVAKFRAGRLVDASNACCASLCFGAVHGDGAGGLVHE